MIYGQPDIKSFLKDLLVQKIRERPSYSMRAFARHLGLAPSMLTAVLSGKRRLSEDRLVQVMGKLALKDKEANYLRLLSRFEAAKSTELKSRIYRELETIRPRESVPNLTIEHFRMIAEWHHIALLETLRVLPVPFSESDAAKALGVSIHVVRDSIERLLRLQLIEQTEAGGYRKTDNRLLADSQVPNEALRKYHRQLLARAQESLEAHSPQERFVGSETIALSDAEYVEIRQLSDQFLDRLTHISAAPTKKTRVYHAYVQVFPAIHPLTPSEKSVKKGVRQ